MHSSKYLYSSQIMKIVFATDLRLLKLTPLNDWICNNSGEQNHVMCNFRTANFPTLLQFNDICISWPRFIFPKIHTIRILRPVFCAVNHEVVTVLRFSKSFVTYVKRRMLKDLFILQGWKSEDIYEYCSQNAYKSCCTKRCILC